MSRFYMNVAEPFAIIKNGKTYLRYMSYPGGSRDYDKTKLELCTYFWRGNKITLTGPNWRFIKSSTKLIKDNHCIGERSY